MTREVDGPLSYGRCSKGKTDGFWLASVKVCTFSIHRGNININHPNLEPAKQAGRRKKKKDKVLSLQVDPFLLSLLRDIRSAWTYLPS